LHLVRFVFLRQGFPAAKGPSIMDGDGDIWASYLTKVIDGVPRRQPHRK